MLCERCHEREATVHYTEVINGKKKQLNLCQECARKLHPQGFGFMPPLNFHNFLGGMMSYGLGSGGFAKTATGENTCSACGLSERQFAQQGLLGCAGCYESFGSTLDSLVRRIHGTNKHTGKVPERTSDRVKLVKEVESLRNKLKQAVEAEEFEQAARLRDAIRELEKRLEQEG